MKEKIGIILTILFIIFTIIFFIKWLFDINNGWLMFRCLLSFIAAFISYIYVVYENLKKPF
jgi:hypothetical protein